MMSKWPIITCATAAITTGCAIHWQANHAAPIQARPAQPAAGQVTATTNPQVTTATFFDRAAGPGSGWLIGAREDFIAENRADIARRANDLAAQSPATVADVANSADADLNHDGFVTLDELLAMKRAGLNDRQIIRRLQNTHQMLFNLNARQQQYLLDRGIDKQVIDAILSLQQRAAPPVQYH